MTASRSVIAVVREGGLVIRYRDGGRAGACGSALTLPCWSGGYDMDVGETIGKGVGVILAPLAAVGSFLRGARLVHAQGVVYRADVRATAEEGALGALAERLAGPAIVRLSSAGAALGAALRFGAGAPQDLILLSLRSLRDLPIAARLTDGRDYLANTYFTIARSRAAGLGEVELRLVPRERIGVARDAIEGAGGDRDARLAREVAAGAAVFDLELREIASGAPWQPLAVITLTGRAEVDQEALRFNPYHAGLGLEPAGFLQGLRWAVYPAAQLGRALRRELAEWWSQVL